ncbi:XP_042229523.1uncharacterized protein LOC121871369 [Octopus vulgaris]|uniref:XP_042229523.1uncharacterized protein LOC121871369 n=1 Tax=Octopus vulgaris TaxID=6645 RepID=A0AA36BHZ1_OCTVU|nr:XP_042229523.1uncharacterized protein LOC121871369 [Octopus vulgaris]
MLDKVTRTTTDNSKNFVTAFMQFGTEIELLLDIPETTADPDVEGVADMDLDMDPEAGDENGVWYISVDAILDESSGLGLMKCAVHSFNLVASVNANKALDSTSFKSANKKAMSKAQRLWNLKSRSTVAADSILETLKRRLVIPNINRWNSTHDSVVVFNNLLEKNRGAVHRVNYPQVKLQTFTDSDVGFLTEYAQVVSHVAKAFDKIQGKDQAYLGSLLPTVAATIEKLNEVKLKHLLYWSPLLGAILTGIAKRLGLLLQDLEYQLTTAFHPKVHLFRLEQYNTTQVNRVTNAMETVVKIALKRPKGRAAAAPAMRMRKKISSAILLGSGRAGATGH